MLRKVSAVLVGARPLEVAVHAQVGIVLRSEMTIKALNLFITYVASITFESAFSRFAHVSMSSRRAQ